MLEEDGLPPPEVILLLGRHVPADPPDVRDGFAERLEQQVAAIHVVHGLAFAGFARLLAVLSPSSSSSSSSSVSSAEAACFCLA